MERSLLLLVALILLPAAFSGSKDQEPTEMEAPPKSANNRPTINLNFFDAFSDARHIVGNVVGKIISKKRIVGLDSEWYW